MRLTEQQKENIMNTFTEVFGDLNAELWLFGSRVDDDKLGGDIDLLIKCYDLNYNDLLDLKERYNFLVEKKIGERKIDIVLEFNDACKQLPIVQNANQSGVLLTRTFSGKNNVK